MGVDLADTVRDMLSVRFNTDRQALLGCKVGLLNRHHWWCFMMNPASYTFRNRVNLPFDICSMAKEMIEHFCPTTMNPYKLVRRETLEEFTVSEKLLFVSISFNQINIDNVTT